MNITTKIQKAIKFSVKTHEVYQKQKRKGKDVAYITHPLTVGIILACAGASEDVVAAGILHDTIEDSIEEKKVNREMLIERFGQAVADLVESVSEKDKSLPWEERKRVAIEHIKSFSHDSLLLKSADLISNISELIDDYKKGGDQIFSRFNAPKEKSLKHYLTAIGVIKERWDKNPLFEDLLSLTEKLTDIK